MKLSYNFYIESTNLFRVIKVYYYMASKIHLFTINISLTK